MIHRSTKSSQSEKITSAPPASRVSRALLASLSMLLLMLAAWNTPLAAQVSQASIRGNVHDATGAVVPNAQLRLTNVATHVEATTTSNEKGDYLYLNLNPGTYTLEASGPGFSSQKLNEFALAVNQTSTLDFTLAIGNVTQVVQVNAVGEGVQASTAEVGSVLGTKQVEDLPLNSRNFTSLLSTTPGVSPITPGGSQVASYTTSIGPILIPSFNGQTNRSDLFYLDGVLDVETFGNAYAVQPIIDTIEDQKMQSHNDSAEFGGSTGGTINIASKAGTNAFHGGGWEFNQTSSLQALPYFTPAGSKQPALSQNQFGGEIGGPVIIPHLYNGRDKTFFYGAYEGYRYNSPGTSLLLVPTAQQLAGNFQGYAPIYDPATTTCDSAGVCTRQQFNYQGVPNTIDPARLDQGDLFYAENALPAVASTPPSPGYNASEPAPSSNSYNSYDARVDETITQKDSAFFRISGLKGPSTSGRSQLPNTTTTDGYQWALNYVHIFSPSSVLHIQGGKVYLNRVSLQAFKGLPANFASTVGYPTGLTNGYVTLGDIIPGFTVDNYFGDTGENGGPQNTANGWSFNGDYTYVLGQHTLKVGAGFNKIGEGQDIEYGNIETRSNETNSLVDGTSGDALASFEIGVPNDATKRNLVESLGFGGVFDAFVQDQWQVNPKLTVNIGLRYDLGLIPRYGTYAANNEYSGNFDFNNGTYVVYKVPGPCAVLNNAPCIPTPDGSLPTDVVASKTGKVFNDTDLNLQPRFGFAYRLLPTTVVRGGFGVAFDEYAALVQNVRGVSGNWPSVGQIQQTNFNVPTPANPFPGITPQTIPNLTSLPPATPFGLENWYVDPNMKDAYSMQWNFGVQRQIDNATVVSATYVASANRRLNVGGLYNVALTPGPGDPTLRRPYPYITPTFYSRSNGSGNYNALQLQLNRSFSHGLAATVAYTWSKSIDEGCSGFFGSEGCNVQQIYNIKADRSVSAFDVPQNFVVSWNYQLPIGRGKELNISNRALDMIAGGWQFNGLSEFHSGTPYSINISADIANIGNSNGYERPNIIKPTRQIQKSLQTSLNPYELEFPAQYTYGDMGRNALRTPFSQNFDLSLFKEVSVEHLTVQLRAEAFDALNHPIFGQAGSTYGGDTILPNGSYVDNFGDVSSTNNSPRSVQLGVKVLF
jgi:hypothetical protein